MVVDDRARFGVRREAERHAALVRAEGALNLNSRGAHESGVAAIALPPQSKTSKDFELARRTRSFKMGLIISAKCR